MYLRGMRQTQILISLTMLFIFSFALSSDVFASNSHPSRCHIQTELSGNGSNDSVQSIVSDGSEHSSRRGQHSCGDPCHFGTCHFGHCSFVLTEVSILPYSVGQTVGIFGGSSEEVEDPFLEGLRRPPRHT